MSRFLARRVLHALIVLWLAFTLSFAVLFVVPGDPVELMLGEEQLRQLSAEQLAAIKAEFGTNRPFVIQYLDQLGGLLRGDLGSSYQNGVDVTTLLVQAAPSTLALAFSALVVGLVLGFGIALSAALTKREWLRALLLALPPLSASLPTFWVGLVLLQVFSFQLGWLPAFGARGPSGLVLPAISLGIPISAAIAQVLHKSLTTTVAEPYADVLRAKGVGHLRLFFRHALRNASLPTLTTVGLVVAGLLGGAVLTETVFSRNGLGQLAATAVSQKDVPVVQGVVLLAAAVFVVVSLLVDLLYTVLDPRIRLEKAAA